MPGVCRLELRILRAAERITNEYQEKTTEVTKWSESLTAAAAMLLLSETTLSEWHVIYL